MEFHIFIGDSIYFYFYYTRPYLSFASQNVGVQGPYP